MDQIERILEIARNHQQCMPYYKILEVSPDADDKTINTKHRSLIYKIHPDRLPELNKSSGTEASKYVNAAKNVLLCQYNEKLASKTTAVRQDDEMAQEWRLREYICRRCCSTCAIFMGICLLTIARLSKICAIIHLLFMVLQPRIQISQPQFHSSVVAVTWGFTFLYLTPTQITHSCLVLLSLASTLMYCVAKECLPDDKTDTKHTKKIARLILRKVFAAHHTASTYLKKSINSSDKNLQ
jgi:hypothetical protein